MGEYHVVGNDVSVGMILLTMSAVLAMIMLLLLMVRAVMMWATVLVTMMQIM